MHDEELARGPAQPVGAVQVAVSPGTLLITLTGEVDAALSEELDEAVRAVRAHGLPVMVDALGVSYIGSEGARFVSQCYAHGPLTVAGSSPVRFLLKLLAMDDVLTPPQ